jgi:membrane fusion protein (multidrug efflux system)
MHRVRTRLVLCLLLAAACDHAQSNAPKGPPPAAVELTTVQPGPIHETIDLVGQLEADESVVLKPEAQGVVGEIAFSEGEEVKRGDLLIRLRDDEQRARLAEAVATLRLAEDDHQRAQSLAKQRTLSPAELDAATSRRNAALARRDLAQVELDRTEIRAPFDGVLGSRMVSPGDRVDTDTELVRIDALSRLRLLFTLPEIAVSLAKVGLPLEIAVAAFPGESFSGEVYFVAPSLDPLNRRLLLKAFVPNDARRLRPGFFAEVLLEMPGRDDALVVPESAIAYDAAGPFVWRVDESGVASHVPVGLGIRRPGQVEITHGLAPGDRIVAAGTHKVVAGGRVRAGKAVAPPEALADAPPETSTR